MCTTHLGTREAARTEERMGPWLRMHDGGGDRVRLEPYDDALRQTLAGPSAGPASGPADRPQILLPARHRGFRGMPR